MKNKKQSITQKRPATKAEEPKNKVGRRLPWSIITGVAFFVLAWVWASWWMGDVLRIAYERSFFAADATLMHWLAQKSFGWLWIAGRALLTLYHWPVVGGLLVALLLTAGTWLTSYCLRLRGGWRCLSYLPAGAWLWWTAHVGLNLFYKSEPGRILAAPALYAAIAGVLALALKLSRKKANAQAATAWHWAAAELIIAVGCFALSAWHLQDRHPYLRPLTRMQVQLLHEDYAGMSATAHEHADICNRFVSGYYALALARTGQLADRLFDIRLEFDSIPTMGYDGKHNHCINYHVIDCDYYAGLYRASRHYAMEEMTMDGPSLYTLKYLTKIALIDGEWKLARKYFGVLKRVPFEGDFISRFEPMVGHAELVAADPEFSAVIAMAPERHSFEQFYLKPGFLGYYANLQTFKNKDALIWSTMACLYAKRMPDFLQRCGKFIGESLPRSIAEGLTIAAVKEPGILKAFPQLEMQMNAYELFAKEAMPYMQDRDNGATVLFEKYKGYYPYYYYFGNLHNSRKPGDDEQEHNRAGVN